MQNVHSVFQQSNHWAICPDIPGYYLLIISRLVQICSLRFEPAINSTQYNCHSFQVLEGYFLSGSYASLTHNHIDIDKWVIGTSFENLVILYILILH